MNSVPDQENRTPDFPSCKVIYCLMPDDGTDRRLLAELRNRHGIIRAGSDTCRAIGALAAAKAKRGKLPQAQLAKKLLVICAEDQADQVFDFIFWTAEVGRQGRGFIWQQAVSGCTPYELPADIPDEDTGDQGQLD